MERDKLKIVKSWGQHMFDYLTSHCHGFCLDHTNNKLAKVPLDLNISVCFLILYKNSLIFLSSSCDRQTDRQTHRRTKRVVEGILVF